MKGEERAGIMSALEVLDALPTHDALEETHVWVYYRFQVVQIHGWQFED